MANDWFDFKEFRIEQDKCGMKVTTDACIQGALAAEYAQNNPRLKTALDIGTGTGLLSLMLAQKAPHLHIDAIEIEENAFAQASENFRNSRYSDMLRAFHCSLAAWQKTQQKPYDFIICNPPFFDKHLQAIEHNRNIARHHVHLTAGDLVKSVERLLQDEGIFCVLYPTSQFDSFLALAEKAQLFLQQTIAILPRISLKSNRVVAFFGKHRPKAVNERHLIIYTAEHGYTEEFKLLLGAYYLKIGE